MDNIPLLTQNAVDLAMSKGILMKISSQSVNCVHIPFTLFPTPIPKTEFENLKLIQPYINELMFLASRDADFLLTSLKTAAETDQYTKKLVEIYQETHSSSTKSVFLFGILRSDYMFDCMSKSTQSTVPIQIEVNTIASSFGAVGGNSLRSVHCRTLKGANREKDIANIPDNPSLTEIAKGFIKAWNAYGNPDAVIVFLVSAAETNIFDQRAIEYEIYSLNCAITVRRYTFENVISSGRHGNDGTLHIGSDEVAVVYFRVGYSPEDYPLQKHWDARLLIEKSRAIKCPDIGLQLIGSKKFQEIFAKPGVVEKFVGDEKAAALIRKTFAGFYPLEMNSEGDEAVKKALKSPDDFVMKPQREGGGNNLYGEDIARFLNEIGCSNKRSAYILMDKIRPKTYKNYIIRKGVASEAETLSEVGIYGVLLGKEKDFVANYCAGHVVRSKPKDVNEGGIVAGAAVLDSPLLE